MAVSRSALPAGKPSSAFTQETHKRIVLNAVAYMKTTPLPPNTPGLPNTPPKPA